MEIGINDLKDIIGIDLSLRSIELNLMINQL